MFQSILILEMIIILVFLSEAEFEELKKGNKKIFEKIYDTYKKYIYNYLLVKTNYNRENAEDLLNETFYSALVSVRKIKNQKNLKIWLMKIAYRRYIDYIRKKQLDKDCMRTLSIITGEEKDVTDHVYEKQKIIAFNIAFEELKEKYKNLIIKKYVEGKKIKEIAAEMNQSPKAIESKLFRAKESLRKGIKIYNRSLFFEEE